MFYFDECRLRDRDRDRDLKDEVGFRGTKQIVLTYGERRR